MATAKKTTKKASTKKATARKTTARTAKATAAKSSAAKSSAAKSKATTSAASANGSAEGFTLHLGSIELTAAELREMLTDSAFAYVGAGDRAIEVARELPEKLESLRKARTEQAESFVKESRGKVETFVKDAPSKLQSELEDGVETARKEFETFAARGRKVVEDLRGDERAKKVLDSTEDVRGQVTTAVTNLRKYVEQGQDRVEAAAERLGLRRSA